MNTLEKLRQTIIDEGELENGRHVFREYVGGDRYTYDFRLCPSSQGWVQYDTDQDAYYFGVWVHSDARIVMTFAEGDLTGVYCPTPEEFNAELKRMDEFYGKAPAFVVVDPDAGTITEYFQDRDALENETVSIINAEARGRTVR